MLRSIGTIFMCSFLLAGFAFAQEVAPFDASVLVKLGDKTQCGIYTVYKIGEGVYQLSDHELHQPDARMGGIGSAMYLIVGEKKAMIIDLGNDYIDGYAKDNLKARKYGAEEFRSVVNGLAGNLPIEAAVTHMHTDHDGMTGALMNRKGVTLWASDKENVADIKTQHGVDPSVFKLFTAGEKTFDLGGGCVVSTFLVRGHTLGGTVFILKKGGLVFIFTGDAYVPGIGSGERLKLMAEDSRKFVDTIFANFSPYERYAIRVYPAHAHTIGEEAKVDMAFYDWRFLQDMATLTNGIVQGKFAEKDSGIRFEEEIKSDSKAPPGGQGTQSGPGTQGGSGVQGGPGGQGGDVSGYMIYGVAKVRMSLNDAYKTAGLKMPQ